MSKSVAYEVGLAVASAAVVAGGVAAKYAVETMHDPYAAFDDQYTHCLEATDFNPQGKANEIVGQVLVDGKEQKVLTLLPDKAASMPTVLKFVVHDRTFSHPTFGVVDQNTRDFLARQPVQCPDNNPN